MIAGDVHFEGAGDSLEAAELPERAARRTAMGDRTKESCCSIWSSPYLPRFKGWTRFQPQSSRWPSG